MAIVPSLVAGGIAAALMRRHRLRFTWGLLAALPLATPLLLVGPIESVDRLKIAVAVLLEPGHRLAPVVMQATPFWLPLSALVATAGKLWIDRRDRLHGGALEAHSRSSIGPMHLMALHHARRSATSEGRYSPTGGVLLGHDIAHRRPTRIPLLKAHATIVGGSNTGKTNTAEVLLEGTVAAGGSFVILDGKGGRDLAYTALALGERYQRPVALWSVLPYGAPQLDALRLRWNVAGGGNPTEIKDRIANAEPQNEPYYKAVAARGVLASTQAIAAAGNVPDLDHIAAMLESPDKTLSAALKSADEDRFASTLEWLATLSDSEKSGLRGMGLRLQTMINSDGGEWLLPDLDGREIDLYRAIKDGWLVVFTLPQGSYPELIPHVARYTVSAVNAVAGRLEREGHSAHCVLFVDELSAFDGDQLCATYERGRSAGIRVVTSTQSLSNLEDVGGIKLLHAAIDNSELFVIHRQAVPETAEALAGIAGTEESWEHTHKIDDAHSFHMGLDEVGERNRRLTDRFRVHPNTIKQLGQGEAVLISQRPSLTVTRLRIELGLSARRRHQAS
jgi:conjugal transfer pilus assembly protein TraD